MLSGVAGQGATTRQRNRTQSRSRSRSAIDNLIEGSRLVGWREWLALPALGIDRIKAKIDTGARTSSLHADDVKELSGGRVQFSVVIDRTGKKKRVTAKVKRKSHVRSSNGQSDLRLIVGTTVRVGPVEKEIEISLSSREDMVYRMLLGRLALEHDFLVDVSHRFLAERANEPAASGKKAKKKKKKATTTTEKKSKKAKKKKLLKKKAKKVKKAAERDS